MLTSNLKLSPGYIKLFIKRMFLCIPVKNIIVLILFIILTLIMTYPLIFNMGSHLTSSRYQEMTSGNDLGDHLYSIWTMSWELKKLFNGITGAWDTNIFYPHKLTLAYSENNIGSTILGLPVALFTGNIIFIYNFVFLLSFILSGFFSYLLIKHLTKNHFAGIIGGIIFTFSAFRFNHFGHIFILNMQWIPLCVLYLHKFFETQKNRYLFFFGIFFVFQWLSSLQNGLFLSVIVVCCFVYFAVQSTIYKNRAFIIKIAILFVVILILLIPLLSPYIQLGKNLGFKRNIMSLNTVANFKSYLTVPYNNKSYIKLNNFGMFCGENSLFLGFTALFLSLIGILKYKIQKDQKLYIILVLLSIILSFGPVIKLWNISIPNIYTIFYYFFPGFNSIRDTTRVAVITTLSLAVLAGFGLKQILATQSKLNKYLIAGFISLIVLSENLSLPIFTPAIKINKDIPMVYQWLNKQNNGFSVLELPVFQNTKSKFDENIYIYYSIYHWKNILNGTSSFFPPEFEWLRNIVIPEFPSPKSIEMLKLFKVKYVIIHSSEFSKETLTELLNKIQVYKNALKIINQFDTDFVCEITGNDSLSEKQETCLATYLDHFPKHYSKVNKHDLFYINKLFYFDCQEMGFRIQDELQFTFNKYHGWSSPENVFTWATGKESTLMFYFPTKIPQKMVIVWTPPPAGNKTHQKVKIFLNDILTGEYIFVSEGNWNNEKKRLNFETCIITFNKNLFNGTLEEIKFVFDHFVIPSNISRTKDKRELSVAIKSIKFVY